MSLQRQHNIFRRNLCKCQIFLNIFSVEVTRQPYFINYSTLERVGEALIEKTNDVGDNGNLCHLTLVLFLGHLES